MWYGALYKLEEQCNKAGYTLGKYKDIAEKIHFGLNAAHIHGIMTDGEWDKALKRLNKKIGEWAEPMDGGVNDAAD